MLCTIARPVVLAVLLLGAGCREPTTILALADGDPHSWARPESVAVEHLTLDVEVDFEARTIGGRASWRLAPDHDGSWLVLDAGALDVREVSLDDGRSADWRLGAARRVVGRPLVVEIEPETRLVHVDYVTRPDAAALQWLAPAQTAGGTEPFLLTQSQAILARTWVPSQDTPSVRFTYEATVRVPAGLTAVMSAAGNPTAPRPDGIYTFAMREPVPSYLLALAVGELAFRPLGERTGVYAEPELIDRAAWELAGVDAMMAAAERLYGPYRWERYDLVVLPASFPMGGMENPRLTFVTPTILAGDRSLVSLVAHELAHSWSGNLVTNATWDDFWLNEGFTTYIERRLMEELAGPDYARMLAVLGRQDLDEDLAELDPRDEWLVLDLAGRDPDDGLTDVAYEKGALFLRWLEERVGRERWDAFLRDYFDRFAFQPMTTERFLEHLAVELGDVIPPRHELSAWVYGPGVPAGAPEPSSPAFVEVERQLAAWLDGRPAAGLETEGWTTHHRLHFLRGLPDDLAAGRLAELDAAFGLSATGNAEVLQAWLLRAIGRGHEPADRAAERFLEGMGRLKFLRPLYREMAAIDEAWARRVYERARPGYHPLSQKALDELLR